MKKLTPIEQTIFDVVAQSPIGLTAHDVADKVTAFGKGAVQAACHTMREKGLLKCRRWKKQDGLPQAVFFTNTEQLTGLVGDVIRYHKRKLHRRKKISTRAIKTFPNMPKQAIHKPNGAEPIASSLEIILIGQRIPMELARKVYGQLKILFGDTK